MLDSLELELDQPSKGPCLVEHKSPCSEGSLQWI